MRPLDNEAFLYAKKRREEGCSIADLTQELIKFGYTKNRGGELCNATLSHFLIDNGLRTYRKRGDVSPNYNEHKIAQIIKTLTAQKKSIKQIARALNREGLTTKRGLKFTWKTVHNFNIRVLQSQLPVVEQKQVAISTTERDLYELINSNLSADLKLKFLKGVLNEKNEKN